MGRDKQKKDLVNLSSSLSLFLSHSLSLLLSLSLSGSLPPALPVSCAHCLRVETLIGVVLWDLEDACLKGWNRKRTLI